MTRRSKKIVSALSFVAVFGALGFGGAHLLMPRTATAQTFCMDLACSSGQCVANPGHMCWHMDGTSKPCTGTTHCDSSVE